MKNIKYLLFFLPVFYAGVATAQSRTTIYGRMDLGYGIGNGGSYEGSQGVDSKFQQWNAASAASIWGIKGAEDLSDDLRVYFQLEAKLNAENGNSTGFKRLSFIGLSGNFGAIQFGRQRNVVNMTLAQFDQTAEQRHAVTRELGAMKTSMLQDVQAGRALEIDALLTVVCEIAQHCHIQTPHMNALLGLVRLFAQVRGLYHR